jgi:hypothetical protein
VSADDAWERLRRYRPEPRAKESSDFDLEDVIDAADLDHYDRILRPASHVHRERRVVPPPSSDWSWSATVDSPSSSSRPPGRRALSSAEPEDLSPARRGGRAETVSSDTRLEPYPSSWCWDVCGYYRILGVRWRATRLELRHAYQELDGHRSRLRTYAMKQLMDPDLRREYDALPLGTVWLKDRYVQEFIKKRAADEARARGAGRRRGWGSWADPTPEDILGEWGFGLDRETEPDDGDLHPPPRRPALSQSGLSLGASWWSQWSYYVIGSPPVIRVSLLERWQALLLRELGRHGIRISFAVGAAEKTSKDGFLVMRAPWTSSLIIFLAEDDLTSAMAAKAVVRAMIVLRRHTDH